MAKKCSTDQRFIWKRNTTYKIHTLGAMSSLVASAWLDKDLKYTLRFVSKSVFGVLATIALVVRTVEWTNQNLPEGFGTDFEEGEKPLDCQNICIPDVTGKNPKYPNFTADELIAKCDSQELALDKRFAGQ